jgi:hypothetical protein
LPDVRAARIFETVQGFGHFAVAAASRRLIVGAGDGSIEAIDLSGKWIDEISVPCNSLQAAELIDDAQSVVVCLDRGPAKVLGLDTGQLLREIPDPADASIPEPLRSCTVLCVDASRDGQRLALGNDAGQVLVWNAADGTLQAHGAAGGRRILLVRWIDDSSVLVSGGEDGAVRLWDLSRADQSRELARHGAVIRGLELSPDGKWLVAVAADGSITRMPVGQWQDMVRIETGSPLQCVAWSPDSLRLAMGDSKGGIVIHRSDFSGQPTRLLGHAGSIDSVVFSPSGDSLMSGGRDESFRFWDLHSGQTKMTSEVHSRPIAAICLAASGERMVTADLGGTVQVWQAGERSSNFDTQVAVP